MQIAELLESGEVGVNGGRAVQADRLGDLTNRRRVAALAHALVNELENAALAVGELVFGHA